MKMAKISISVIVTFVILSESGIFPTTTEYSTEGMSRTPGPKASIVRVLLKSGETREFGRKDQARIINGAIVRRGTMVTVRTSDPVDISRDGDTYVINTGDGRRYRASVYSLDAANGRLTCATLENAPHPALRGRHDLDRDPHTDRAILMLLGVIAAVVWAKSTPIYYFTLDRRRLKIARGRLAARKARFRRNRAEAQGPANPALSCT